MNIFKLSLVAGIFACAIAVVPSGMVAAQTPNDAGCTVSVVGTQNTANQKDSKFTLKDNKVTAKFKVTGKNCKEGVTLAAWEAPKNNRPLSDQKLYKYTQGTFAAGTHSLTVEIPVTENGKVAGCYYQVDLVRGLKPTDDNGGPKYGKERNMGWLVGGAECKEAPKPPITPTTPKKPTETPESLPVTGPGAIAGLVASVSTVSGGLHYFIRRRYL